jgi:hypothetical protein
LEGHEAEHYAAYENELQRVWPLDEENRKSKIEQFARNMDFAWPITSWDRAPSSKKIRDQSGQTRALPFLIAEMANDPAVMSSTKSAHFYELTAICD